MTDRSELRAIESTLEETEISWTSKFSGQVYTDRGWEVWVDCFGDPATFVPGLGMVKVVEQEGGGEGQGEYANIVFQVVSENAEVRYFRKEGFYSSFDGIEWDGTFEEVTPVKKYITAYERV